MSAPFTCEHWEKRDRSVGFKSIRTPDGPVCLLCHQSQKPGTHEQAFLQHAIAKQADVVIPTNKSAFTFMPSYPVPGDVLKMVIHAVSNKVPCSACIARIKQMNEWGWVTCWHKRETIYGWLKEEAAKYGAAVDDATLKSLAKAAFRELLKKKARVPANPAIDATVGHGAPKPPLQAQGGT